MELQPFSRRGLRNFDRGVRRYEPVVAAVCAIVLLARYGPGGGDRDTTLPFSAPPAVVAAPLTSETSTFETPDTTLPIDLPTVAPGAVSEPTAAGAIEGAQSAATTPATAQEVVVKVGSVSTFAAVPDGHVVGGLATADDGSVFAGITSADGKASLLHLAKDGKPRRDYDLAQINGDVADVIVGQGQVVFVLGASPARVVALNTETGEELVMADIPDVLPCLPVVASTNCDGSVIDRAPRAESFAFNPAGDLYITDSSQGAVWRLEAGEKTTEQVVVSADLAGPAGPTGGQGVNGIAIDGRGSLLLTTERLGDGPGAVLVQRIAEDGRAGERAELYRAADGDGPADVVLGRSGRVYVALRTAGQLLSIGSAEGDVVRLPAEGGALGAPTSIAFGGSGVFVSTIAASQPPSNVILRVEAGEQGSTQSAGGRG